MCNACVIGMAVWPPAGSTFSIVPLPAAAESASVTAGPEVAPQTDATLDAMVALRLTTELCHIGERCSLQSQRQALKVNSSW